MKKKFKHIYYVLQIVPCVKTCGQTFNRQTAKIIANEVQRLTGAKSVILKFDRKELQELNFKK